MNKRGGRLAGRRVGGCGDTYCSWGSGRTAQRSRDSMSGRPRRRSPCRPRSRSAPSPGPSPGPVRSPADTDTPELTVCSARPSTPWAAMSALPWELGPTLRGRCRTLRPGTASGAWARFRGLARAGWPSVAAALEGLFRFQNSPEPGS